MRERDLMRLSENALNAVEGNVPEYWMDVDVALAQLESYKNETQIETKMVLVFLSGVVLGMLACYTITIATAALYAGQ